MARKAHCGYGIFLILGFLLTLVALFTPGWRSYKGQGAPDLGLISRNCGTGNRQVEVHDCKAWGRYQLPFEKTTLGLMLIALLLEIVSIGCFIGAFSPRARLGIPAFTITGAAFICLFLAVIIYGVRMQYKTAYLQSTTFELLANVYLGYSYWIAVLASFLMLIASALSGGMISPEAGERHIH